MRITRHTEATEGSVRAERPAGSERGLRQAVVALRYKDFRRFWTGAAISNVGSWMQNLTVPYVIFQLTQSAAWVGFAAFIQLAPTVVLGPVAGWLADRFSRRALLLLGQALQAVFALALWAAWVAHHRSPGVLLWLIGLNGAAFAATMPAWQAFVTELVPRKHLLNAITLNSAQFNAARAVGPALGGLVLGRFGPSWAFLVNALSFVAVIGALGLIRPRGVSRAVPTGRLTSQFTGALTYTRRHPGILTAIGLVSATFFFGSPVFQLMAVFARRVYDIGPALYGVLASAQGIGAVVGAVALGTLGARRQRSEIARGALALYGAALVGFGLARSFPLGVVLLCLSGIGFLSLVATLNTSVQLIVAEHMRGRVISIYMMALAASYPLGALLQGWMADRIGAPQTVVLAGSALLLVWIVLLRRPGLVSSLDEHAHRGRPPAREPVLEAPSANPT